MEKSIDLNGHDPVDLFGVQDKKLKIIREYFPKVKIVARGSSITAYGEEAEINEFLEKFGKLMNHLNRYNTLTEGNIHRILEDDKEILKEGGDEVIVHGVQGIKVKARTANQRAMVRSSEQNDMLFAIGPAGTGKTYTAVALAVRALKEKRVRRIILTRPAVEAGENLGFLPGDLKEKLDPYLRPLYDALGDMIPPEKLHDYLETGVIEVAPLAFMRGRTLDNAFVILDESQNSTEGQIKMFLTRMGRNAKFIITGDLTQNDLLPNQRSGLAAAMHRLRDVEGIGMVELDEQDVIRHELVKKIIAAFKDND